MPGSGDPEGEPEDAPDTSVDAVDLGGEADAASSDPSAAGGGGPARKAKGKATRWNIPPHALQILEKVFQDDKFPSVETRRTLAGDLKVTPRQVQVWFQNKRQRSVKPPIKAAERRMLHTSVRCLRRAPVARAAGPPAAHARAPAPRRGRAPRRCASLRAAAFRAVIRPPLNR